MIATYVGGGHHLQAVIATALLLCLYFGDIKWLLSHSHHFVGHCCVCEGRRRLTDVVEGCVFGGLIADLELLRVSSPAALDKGCSCVLI